MEKRFNKYDRIKFDNNTYQCVCEDNEIAIFAPAIENSVKYEDIFAVSNIKQDDGFKYEVVE